MSFIAFDELVYEIGAMLADLSMHGDIAVKVTNADQILGARQQGKLGVLPTVEHLGIGDDIGRLDVLHALGVRIGGITYARRNAIGDGQNERSDAGLSRFGREVIARMNELGMVIDVSHAGHQTAMEAIEHSTAPVVFSHNASYTLRPTARTRRDDELLACAAGGGLIGITAVPNSLSDDPRQDISCVLDHYDYMVKLVGVDHVGIGTDTLIGDHVGYHITMMGRPLPGPDEPPLAPYLAGLESPADGANIIRGLIARGHSDDDITKIAGGNELALFRRVIG
jgi:membrane dipeptidase